MSKEPIRLHLDPQTNILTAIRSNGNVKLVQATIILSSKNNFGFKDMKVLVK